MRRAQHYNNTATAVITTIFIILSICLFSTSTAQTTSLRCQKSGCREGDNSNDESSSPTIIVTKPKSNAFPTLISYIIAFLLLRLGFRYMKKLIPIVRDRLPQIRYMIGHYYHDYILSPSSTDIRRVSRSNSIRDNSSYISLGSLAEFVDSDHSVGSTTIGDDDEDNDNDSYSTKSGYSTETGTSVGLSELLSDNDTTTEAFNSRRELAGRRRGSVGSLMNSVASSAGTSYSSYDSSKDDEEDTSTIGGTTITSRASILSKFLNYITESNNNATSSRHNQMTQRERNGIYGHNAHHPRRRSSIDYSVFSSSNNVNSSNDIEKQRPYKHSNYYSRSNNGNNHHMSETTTTRQRPRRSTVDDSFNHQRSTSTYLTSHHNATKSKSSNASINNSGIKMRKNSMVASAVAKEESGQIINEGSEKKKVHQMQQQSKKKHDGNNNDDEEDKKKKKSSLHHHLSKFTSSSSSSKKNDDDENYSTMMSTVDLRTRASFATGLSTK